MCTVCYTVPLAYRPNLMGAVDMWTPADRQTGGDVFDTLTFHEHNSRWALKTVLGVVDDDMDRYAYELF